MDRVEVLGAPVDRLSMDETMARIEEFVAGAVPRVIVTADAAGLVKAQSDASFLDIIRKADLVTPDSVGVLWAARRVGKPISARVSGVELVDRICAASSAKGWRIFFLGAEPGVAEMAAEKMRLRHPGCHIVGTRHGYFPPESDAVVAVEVAEAKPDVLFVAMGIPRQEKFIWSCKDVIGAKVSMGVGGSLDVFSGKAKRAPAFFQKLHVEWLWRLILNPKKIAKAKNLPVFVAMVLRGKR